MNPDKKCQWEKDANTGDLFLVCCGRPHESARISRSILDAVTGDNSAEQSMVVAKLKAKIEQDAGCDGCFEVTYTD